MKKKIAEFTMMEESDLKGIAIAIIIAVVMSPIVFKIVFAPMGWWL